MKSWVENNHIHIEQRHGVHMHTSALFKNDQLHFAHLH